MYEHGTGGAFYNRCVTVAVECLIKLLRLAATDSSRDAAAAGAPLGSHSAHPPSGVAPSGVVTFEVGAGTGGTASSVLPILDGACSRYVFTDVSEFFLRQARVRFAQYGFVEYSLLNIDANPRLQGFPSQQADLLISTNCLHATPFMRNTLRHCRQLLKPTGMLVVNEAMYTSAFLQITFGMTDGWWLFGESCDPERVGQDSPLLCWRQWQSLLTESGFKHHRCVQGESFLRGQAVVIAQASSPAKLAAAKHQSSVAKASGGSSRDGAVDGLHFFSGGMGGLGLLTARLLVEGGARHLVLSSRSDRVVSGSEADWAWLAAHQASGATVQRVRCDVSDSVAVRATLLAVGYASLGAQGLGGIFHAAHALADGTLAKQHALSFRTTYGPKVHGAAALHAITSGLAPRLFAVYSSLAGLMGSAAQVSTCSPRTAPITTPLRLPCNLDRLRRWCCRPRTRRQALGCTRSLTAARASAWWGRVSHGGLSPR